jgi:Zn-dependent alcohol dehydrogenase
MTTTSQKSLAVIANGSGSYGVEVVEVNPPGAGEVRVRLVASGLCHTDHDSIQWGRPLILGHEGAGVVDAVGEGVTRLAPGDRVLLNWAISCGNCFQCRGGAHALCERHSPVAGTDPSLGHAHPEATTFRGKPIERSFNLGTLSEWTVVRQEAVVRLPEGIPFSSACIMGCGVMTGYGSAVNAAKVRPGASVVVLGCGGVGLNVIQGARIAGATTLIGVDLSPSRLDMARQFGATHCIQAQSGEGSVERVFAKVLEWTNQRGADFAFEATANPALGAAPLRMIRHGGMAVQVSGIEAPLTIDMRWFEWDKTYINPLYGQCCPERDFPALFSLYHSGKLLLDELVSRTYKLEKVAEAFEHMLDGSNAKGVILLDQSLK